MTPTPEQVAAWAQEARLGAVLTHNSVEGGRVYIEGADWHEELQRFAALVAAHQAEQDAKLCEQQETEFWSSHEDDNWTPVDCADAIRASVKGGA